MSFKCQYCGKAQEVGTKPVKVVTETRHVTYPVVKDYLGNERTPEGFEIVREINCCKECAELLEGR
jgi:formylmethanofuran:tetrahydromethanopterin formyltransferase